MKAETKKLLLSKERGRAELIVFLAYITGVIVIGIFHEPWFDEAQAWSIARSAPFKDIIFDIPHYEGHPPFWSLLLAVFAKPGAPYEFTLKAVNLVICAAAVWLILYRSPFPKIVRCAIPFSFYFFYQTAVICRPYSLMLLSLTLAAISYKNRNERPMRYILPLMLLCASHAFGIVLAGGLCLVWVFEIVSAAAKEHKTASLIKDKRCLSLLVILVFALAVIALIIPAEDVYYIDMDKTFTDHLKDLYLLLVHPADSLFGIYLDVDHFKQTTSGLITTMAGGALVLAFLFTFTKANRKLATFAVPYFMFLIFGIFKYLHWNHLCVSTFFIMFTLWIIFDSGEVRLPAFFGKLRGKIESKMTVTLAKCAVVFMAAMPLAWSVSCSVMDIISPYGMREVASYIKDNGMIGHTVMVCWQYDYKDETYEDFRCDENRVNRSNQVPDASSLSPYFDGNIFYNFNTSHPTDLYSKYKQTPPEDNERNFTLWRQYGYPEYMIIKCPLDSVFPELEYKDIKEMYDIVDMFERNVFYKFSAVTEYVHIFKLKDEYKGKGVPQ